jgi:mRNA-degrading endonuclease RelE of RelBE toxin-antitoxin system
MKYNVIPVDKFKKEAKRLIKKYTSLKSELKELNNILSVNPAFGTPLGNNTYKIRVSIKVKEKAKVEEQGLLLIHLLKIRKFIY